MATIIDFPDFELYDGGLKVARGLALGLAFGGILWILVGVAVFVAMT